ncbi:MAG TPA: hypothetical protein VFV63_08375, partial [Ilumatobacteraceae bacterium]|nr:hypothetical protein [Ilumatobacteraceae bacterium]
SASADLIPQRLVVTDSNRDQARQWRGSQDTRGFTESGGEGADVATFDSADQRLDVFDDTDATTQTVALQAGPVTARASAYGELFAYRPEDRAAMAIDGDPATAWRVADRFDAVGEFIEVTAESPIETIDVLQPVDGSSGAAPNRWITAVDVSVDGGEPVRSDLDETSRSSPGQRLALPAAGTAVRLTIAATAAVPGSGDGLVATGLDAVGFAEIDTGLGPTVEVTRPPIDWVEAVEPEVQVDQVLTRLRIDPANRWRRDPEPRMVRDIIVPPGHDAAAQVTVRVDARAPDRVLADLLGLGGATASERLTGMPTSGGWSATDDDPATAWITPFGRPIGPTLTVPVATTAIPSSVATIELRQPVGDFSPITELTVAGAAGDAITADVPPPGPDGWSSVDIDPIEAAGEVTITITGADVQTTRDRRSNEIVALPAAIAEIRLDGIVVSPLPTEVDLGCRELLTVDGTPREFDLGTVDVRQLLAGAPLVADRPCADGQARIAARVATIRIESGSGSMSGLDVDRIVLRDTVVRSSPAAPPIDVELLEQGRTSRTVRVAPCPVRCWVVLGEGLNDGWSAAVDGDNDIDLGEGQLVDGGFNGWSLPPSTAPRTVTFRWTPQGTVTTGLVLSGLAVAVCIALVIFFRRRHHIYLPRPPRLVGFGRERSTSRQQMLASTAVTAALGFLLAGPVWALLALAIAVCTALLGRSRLLAVAALAIWAGCGAIVLWRVVRYRPFPDAGWPGTFEDLHRPGMLVLALLAGTLVTRTDGRMRDRTDGRAEGAPTRAEEAIDRRRAVALPTRDGNTT